MVTVPKLMTADEVARLPEDEQSELERGEAIATSPVGWSHGSVVVRLGARLLAWADQGAGGYVGTETGCLLAHNPDTLYAPDILYITADRVKAAGLQHGYWEGAPDLAVEVMSPSDGAIAVREKVRRYLQSGARLVWVVYPPSREVIAYFPDGSAMQYGENDDLTNAHVLPGFGCTVAELFG